MSIIIRRATPRDRFVIAQAHNQTSFDDMFDINHVAQKFPLLEGWLRERLGKAITRRRQFLRYARDHRSRLGKEPTELWKPEEAIAAKPVLSTSSMENQSHSGRTVLTQHASTLAPTVASTLHDISIALPETDFEDNQSQSSFALSLGEEELESRQQLPRLIDVSKGASTFECPLCCTIQSIRKEISWQKHVLSDLRPYVCTIADCDAPIFSDSRNWIAHELEHRTSWNCGFCKEEFQTSQNFQNHLQLQHTKNVTNEQLMALSETRKCLATSIPASDCPFCHDWELKLRKANPSIAPSNDLVVTPAQYKQHVGSHMRQLAVFVIPRGFLEDDGDNNSVSGFGTGCASSLVGTNAFKRGTTLESGSYVTTSDYSDNFSGEFDTDHIARLLSDTNRSNTLTKALITLSNLRHSQISRLKIQFNFSNLTKMGYTPDFAEAVYVTSLGRYKSDAYWLSEYSTLSSTVEYRNVIMQILAGRSEKEISAINEAVLTYPGNEWLKEYPETQSPIGLFIDRMSGDERDEDFLHALSQNFEAFDDGQRSALQIERDAHGWKELTDCSNQNDIRTALNYTFRRSDTYIRRLSEAFDRIHTPPWVEEISRIMSHRLGLLLRHIIDGANNRSQRDARYLHSILLQSFDSWYPLTSLLIRIHWKSQHLRSVKAECFNNTRQTLASAIAEKTTGEYRQFCLALIQAKESTEEDNGSIGIDVEPLNEERISYLDAMKKEHINGQNMGVVYSEQETRNAWQRALKRLRYKRNLMIQYLSLGFDVYPRGRYLIRFSWYPQLTLEAPYTRNDLYIEANLPQQAEDISLRIFQVIDEFNDQFWNLENSVLIQNKTTKIQNTEIEGTEHEDTEGENTKDDKSIVRVSKGHVITPAITLKTDSAMMKLLTDFEDFQKNPELLTALIPHIRFEYFNDHPALVCAERQRTEQWIWILVGSLYEGYFKGLQGYRTISSPVAPGHDSLFRSRQDTKYDLFVKKGETLLAIVDDEVMRGLLSTTFSHVALDWAKSIFANHIRNPGDIFVNMLSFFPHPSDRLVVAAETVSLFSRWTSDIVPYNKSLGWKLLAYSKAAELCDKPLVKLLFDRMPLTGEDLWSQDENESFILEMLVCHLLNGNAPEIAHWLMEKAGPPMRYRYESDDHYDQKIRCMESISRQIKDFIVRDKILEQSKSIEEENTAYGQDPPRDVMPIVDFCNRLRDTTNDNTNWLREELEIFPSREAAAAYLNQPSYMGPFTTTSNWEFIQILIDHGADINAVDGLDRSVLEECVCTFCDDEKMRPEQIIERTMVLIEAGAKLKQQERDSSHSISPFIESIVGCAEETLRLRKEENFD
ncbi:hypothetical protein B0J11DRAFT_157717 [Dendryphion nanum]|uniref:C2H2-type domain-containing protein n=1 Tax=Dendryphion nanum TaxID=256645 RepID=A0A9P9IX00_9PLEO|nr:hypothetical protein B0J11DRAFT_157717 [Dendryphion nanum]